MAVYGAVEERITPSPSNYMHCKTFAKQHASYLDDTLPGIEMAAMRAHLAVCVPCARRDIEVRRALLLLRNAPPIRVSAGFADRLRERLQQEEPAGRRGHEDSAGRRRVAIWVAAATLPIAIGLGSWAFWQGRPSAPVRLPAVVAVAPLTLDLRHDDAAPAFVASLSTGIPIWPALMLAEEGPLRFAATEPVSTSWQPPTRR